MAKDILKQNEMCTLYLFNLQDLKFLYWTIVLTKPKLKLIFTIIIIGNAIEYAQFLNAPKLNISQVLLSVHTLANQVCGVEHRTIR